MAVFSFFKNMVLAVVLTAAGAMSANAAIVSNSDTQSFEPFGFMVSSQTAPSAAFLLIGLAALALRKCG